MCDNGPDGVVFVPKLPTFIRARNEGQLKIKKLECRNTCVWQIDNLCSFPNMVWACNLCDRRLILYEDLIVFPNKRCGSCKRQLAGCDGDSQCLNWNQKSSVLRGAIPTSRNSSFLKP